MANLPRRERNFKKASKRIILIAAGFIVFSSMAVVSSPTVSNMASGIISYFDAPREFKYLSKQAAFEQFNSQVGISTSDQGIKLTVDNLAVDDNYINVFYTIESDEPIQLLGDGTDPEHWRVNWTAPVFWFKESGRYIQPSAQNEIDAYLKNEYVLKGMQRVAIMEKLEDKLNLELYTDEIFNKKGDWHIAMSVDKSSVDVESLTVTPGIKAKVTSDWKGQRKHDITIEKVSISPFGSQIVISERAENTFNQFALRDDLGKYLTVIPSATYGGKYPLIKTTNSFEFIGGRTDMRELTLIPIAMGSDDDGLPAPELVTVDIGSDPIPMPQSELGGYVMDKLEITPEKAVATFHREGVVSIIDPNLMFFDEKGEYINLTAFHDAYYNRETGEITITLTFQNATEDDIAKIKKVGYFTENIKLKEDEAIRIPLK